MVSPRPLSKKATKDAVILHIENNVYKQCQLFLKAEENIFAFLPLFLEMKKYT